MHIKSTLLLSTLLVTTAVSAPLMAASANGFYLGGGFGYSFVNQDDWDGPDYTFDWKGSGFKLFSGYLGSIIQDQLSMGVDFDFAYLGEINATGTDPIFGVSYTDDDNLSYFALNLAANYVVNDKISIMGRLGVHIEHEYDGSISDSSSPNLFLGIQGNYYFNNNFSSYLSLDYLHGENLNEITDDSALQATSIGLGVQYNFS